ncbi:hypothetical protein L1987_04564 [Smallanthus sonchifolius]|uniref:Uncharacterized protein n=1 Tax=Smallanthus sonchifolius TaxID=185202 RepID=A0ACB9JT17_9ASTR|nr:hypothetical protein L1987_04564 [Smallanthus sonchifolius]
MAISLNPVCSDAFTQRRCTGVFYMLKYEIYCCLVYYGFLFVLRFVQRRSKISAKFNKRIGFIYFEQFYLGQAEHELRNFMGSQFMKEEIEETSYKV